MLSASPTYPDADHNLALAAGKSLRDSQFRKILENTFCIKVRGRAVIEDYERIKSIAAAFPEVVKLINKSHESALFSSHAYLDLKAQIESAEKDLRSIKDRNSRAKGELHIKAMKQELGAAVESAKK